MSNQIDVVQLVRNGKAHYEWHWIISQVGNVWLRIAVLRDAMKFNGIPSLDWYRRPKNQASTYAKLYDGVRLPASAEELQQIADILGGMLLTPRVVDLIWLQAGLRFNANVNSGKPSYTIAAEMDVTTLHKLIETDIAAAGGDDGSKLISCVGKYWVLINQLIGHPPVQGDVASCNYGWASTGASGPGLTPGVKVWQRPGYRHNKRHLDPSQTIRLMHRRCELSLDEGHTWESASMLDIAANPNLAPLIAWDKKVLSYLRQDGVEEQPMGSHIVLPPVTITAGGTPGPKAGATS